MSRVHEALARAAAEAGRSEPGAVVRQRASGPDFLSPWDLEVESAELDPPVLGDPDGQAAPAVFGSEAPGAGPRGPRGGMVAAAGPALAAVGPGAARLESQLASEWPQPFAPDVADKLVVTGRMPVDAREQYAGAVARLQEIQRESGAAVFAVMGPRAGEGTTLTAVNLALTLNEATDRRVLLVDGCTRHHGIHRLFQVSAGRPGLTGLESSIELTRRLVLLPQVRATGEPQPGPAPERVGALLAETRSAFQWIVIDAGAVGVDAEASAFVELADRVVLVATPHSTPSAALRHAVDLVGAVKLAGIILNRASGAGRH